MTDKPTIQVLLMAIMALLAGQTVALAQDTEASPDREFSISVELDTGFSRQSVSGRLFLLVTPNLIGEPRHLLKDGVVGFVFAQDVEYWKPGEAVTFSSGHRGFPTSLGEIPVGRYNLQAILDRHPTDREVTFAAGNGRSRAKRENLDPASGDTVRLKLNREIIRNKLTDISRLEYREIELRSVGRKTQTRTWATCAIILPPNYKHDKEKTYPVQYWIPDFGTTARGALNFFQTKGIFNRSADLAARSDKFIYVLIDPHCKNGHHFWMNSENNGPYRTALIDELMPAIENEYRVQAKGSSRFMVGIGAGGLAAINLIIDRPDLFAGAWALAPDFLSFKSFLGIDLYAAPPQNAYLDTDSQPRAMVLDPSTGRTILTIRAQSELEDVLGPGNKISGFEAAFGPVARSGQPSALFNRRTGKLNLTLLSQWQQCDVERKLASLPEAQRRSVARRIHIKAGRLDPYGMVESTELFKKATDALGLGIDVVITDGETRKNSCESAATHAEVQVEITRAARTSR